MLDSSWTHCINDVVVDDDEGRDLSFSHIKITSNSDSVVICDPQRTL